MHTLVALSGLGLKKTHEVGREEWYSKGVGETDRGWGTMYLIKEYFIPVWNSQQILKDESYKFHFEGIR